MSPPRRSVALIHGSLRYGGSERVVVEQVRALAPWGVPVDVWCAQDGATLELEPSVRAANPHVREVACMPSAGSLFRRLVRTRPSAVVTSFVPRAYRALSRQRRLRFVGRPAVVETVHERYRWSLIDPGERRRRLVDVWMLTHDVRAALESSLGVPSDRTAIARPLFRSSLLSIDDAARAGGLALRASLGIPRGAVVVGYLGRLGANKGIHHLPAILGALLARGLDAHLVLAGRWTPDPAYETAVRAAIDFATAARAEVGERVHVVGDVPACEPVLAAYDVAVLLSKTEGLLPLALVEQMSVGLPVVTTDVGGIGQCLVDGRDAAVVAKTPDDENDPTPEVIASFTERLARLVADRAERGRLGTAGRRRVEHLVATNDFGADFRGAVEQGIDSVAR